MSGMLLGGLYVVMNMTMTQTQASRDAVDAANLSRAVFNKISLDLSNVLGPPAARSGEASAPSAVTFVDGSESSTTDSSTTTSSTSTTTTTPSGTTTTASTQSQTTTKSMSSGSTTSSNSSNSSTSGPTVPLITYQVGVMGNDSQLTIFVSRVPTILATPGALNQTMATNDQQPSDLYRVDYWVAQGGGLCRKETPWVTSDTAGGTADIDRSTEATDVIVPEVAQNGLLVEYLDTGGQSTSSWDGSSATPPSPPKAVRITVTFNVPAPGGQSTTQAVSQVFVMRTAQGDTVPTLVDPVVPSGNSPSSGSSSSSGGKSTSSSSGTTKTTGTGGKTGGTTKTGGG
jgi:hypothetical protein